MSELFHESSFSRTVANIAKMGAYYTDVSMCRRMGNLIKFPVEGEVAVLEPSIGNGAAVSAVLETAAGNCATPVFGVELNEEVASTTKQLFMDKGGAILQADFLTGCRIAYSGMGFCFANPPYGEEPKTKKRYEVLFLERIYNYLKKDGVVLYVIPHYVLATNAFMKTWEMRFVTDGIYRFDDNVYKQFQQVVLVGHRRAKQRVDTEEILEERRMFLERISDVTVLPYLPEELDEEKRVLVPQAPTSGVSIFASDKFDYDQAAIALRRSNALRKELERKCRANDFATALKSPPVPPKKDLLYLTAIAGGGQGLCGSEEERNLHLQRGVVKIVKEEEATTNEKGDKVIVERTKAAISLTVIENDGVITLLK